MDITLHHSHVHPHFFQTLAADITSFVAGLHLASTQTPVLAGAKMFIMDAAPALGFAPSQGVVDDIVRMGAALVVSVLSRLIIKIFEPKNKHKDASKEKKVDEKSDQETHIKEK